MRIAGVSSRTSQSSWVVLVVALALSAGALFAADISGLWTGSFAPGMNPQNVHPFLLNLKVDGPKLTGTMTFCKGDCSHPMGALAIEDGKVDGDTISFDIQTDATDVPHIDFQGTITDDSIQFVVSGKAPGCGGSECQIGQGSATRKH